MEVKGRLYTVNYDYIQVAMSRIYYDDLQYVRLPEGSNTFIVTGYQSPAHGTVLHALSRGNRRDRNRGQLTTELKVRPDEVESVIEIFKNCIPKVKIEERSIKYTEGRRSFIGLSLLILLLAIFAFVLPMVLDFELPSLFQNPAVVFGGAAVLIVVVNIIGFITMDRSKTVKVFTNCQTYY